MHSSNLGDKTSTFHDAEVDFGTSSSSIAGVIMYSSARNVTWYLMTSQHIPSSCPLDSECISSAQTTTGYVKFSPSKIHPNNFYYMCAFSSQTNISRESFTEFLPEIHDCSNGFVIDTISPIAGHVEVTNNNNYITDASTLLVTWDNFHDSTDVGTIGYEHEIKGYTVEVGT